MEVIVPGQADGETDETLRERLQARESEVRQLRRQLVIAQRTVARNEKLQALGQLMAGVAHEMANPLTAVLAYASLIATAKTLEDARRHAATTEKQGQRATQIVQTLSVFARGRRATRRPVSLNDVARTVIDLRRDQLAAGRVEVIEALDPELPLVEGDPYELERVVQNLVSNDTVDDEPEFGHLLTDLLGRGGYETHYVDSAAAGGGNVEEEESLRGPHCPHGMARWQISF